MRFRKNNPLVSCMGTLCAGPTDIAVQPPFRSTYLALPEMGQYGPYVQTLAPTEAAYYPIEKRILSGNPDLASSLLPVVLIGLAAAGIAYIALKK